MDLDFALILTVAVLVTGVIWGGDAVLLLDQYLNKLGITEKSLTIQTQGYIGAVRDQKRAQEELALAQAQFAEKAGG